MVLERSVDANEEGVGVTTEGAVDAGPERQCLQPSQTY